MNPAIFLFGEAEKGELGVPIEFKSLPQLLEILGHPREESIGVQYAIQTLLFKRDLIFCRVEEEGFSTKDYIKGLNFLKAKYLTPKLQAISIPGVGDQDVIETAMSLCLLNKSLLILTEKDLYDYLTHYKPT